MQAGHGYILFIIETRVSQLSIAERLGATSSGVHPTRTKKKAKGLESALLLQLERMPA